MITKTEIMDILSSIKTSRSRPYCSEMDFQTDFIVQAVKALESKYIFVPGYIPLRSNKRMMVDCMVKDKHSAHETYIEFKLKTKKLDDVMFDGIRINKGADNPSLGRLECWSDISRIEKAKLGSEIANGFLILLTDIDAYLGSNETINCNMNSGNHKPGDRSGVNGDGAFKTIKIECPYKFEYFHFNSGPVTGKRTKHEYRCLVVEI